MEESENPETWILNSATESFLWANQPFLWPYFLIWKLGVLNQKISKAHSTALSLLEPSWSIPQVRVGAWLWGLSSALSRTGEGSLLLGAQPFLLFPGVLLLSLSRWPGISWKPASPAVWQQAGQSRCMSMLMLWGKASGYLWGCALTLLVSLCPGSPFKPALYLGVFSFSLQPSWIWLVCSFLDNSRNPLGMSYKVLIV